MKEKTTIHLFRLILKKFSSDEANAYIRWLKHPSGPDGAEITQQEVVITIIRAIQKYVGTYETILCHSLRSDVLVKEYRWTRILIENRIDEEILVWLIPNAPPLVGRIHLQKISVIQVP
jgi:hypothetical protein